MRPFRFMQANGLDGALEAGAAPDARYLAGGTTIVDLAKLEVETPALVIHIGGLPLRGIETLPDGRLRLGALATNRDVAEDAAVKERFPALSEALLSGASPQIRNMATIGGNLMQRTRCPYFRDVVYACNKRNPGSGCAAVQGYHRQHAVLGTSESCFASHPSDMSVALAALDAVIRTRDRSGREREIPADSFHVAYGENPARESVLEPGELILSVDLPSTAWFARSRYEKVRDRASYEFALASAAVALDVSGGRILDARVALGGVATKPWRSREAEAALRGKPAERDVFAAAAGAALGGAAPRRDNRFKVELARHTLVRALEEAARA